MEKRLKLHEMLCSLLGSRNVYFQPPESVRMQYPAIVYGRDGINNTYADDGPYTSRVRYFVTLIDLDPDSLLVKKMASIPYCRYDRHYESDNLNHDVFTLYF